MSLADSEFSTPGIFTMLVIGTVLLLGVEFMEWYGHLILDWAAKFGLEPQTWPGIRELSDYFASMSRTHLP